ncbi:hypothetical protein [Paenibacillus daejeonensis]|uniref:hypothetical protein n=1 Tax=Paenibacillus daejeonensis TaxID=135193 RepID=UPI000A032526|nr:hypothetical protein [Paenibacillus daejeonensis]
MARFQCKCGKILSNTQCPNEIELHVFSDFQYEEITTLKPDEYGYINLPETLFDVWRCPTCERMHIFDGAKLVKTYKIETE